MDPLSEKKMIHLNLGLDRPEPAKKQKLINNPVEFSAWVVSACLGAGLLIFLGLLFFRWLFS